MRLLFRILLVNQILAALLLIVFTLMYGLPSLPRLWLPVFVFTQTVGGCVGLLFAGLNGWEIYQGAPRLAQHAVRAGTVVVGTALGVLTGFLSLQALRPGARFDHRAMLDIGGFALLVAAVMAVIHIVFQNLKTNIEQKAVEIQKLKELEAQTRLTSLQSKVNPHFLFNTLNTMLNLVHTSPDAVEGLILRLSDLYRRVLTLPDHGFIPLSEELDLVRDYLKIEQVRLGNRLTFTLEMEPEAAAVRISPLLGEPLVENAVKHGIRPKLEGGHIHIQARLQDAFLCVEVEDDGIGPSAQPGTGGFGLYSIRERLGLVTAGGPAWI